MEQSQSYFISKLKKKEVMKVQLVPSFPWQRRRKELMPASLGSELKDRKVFI